MKVENLNLWEAFQNVAKYGGFAAAARKMKISIPQLSKRIAKLEEQLGLRLFRRSTRSVLLTNEGEVILPKIALALENLGSIESTFESNAKLSGTIKITSVPFVAHRLLIPIFQKFMDLNPGISFDLDLSERLVNLTEDNIDIAIRIHATPTESGLIYRKLVPNKLILCASPLYLARHKPIKKLEDLKAHCFLMLNIHKQCLFEKKRICLADLEPKRVFYSDQGWFLTQLALQHCGVLVRSVWDVKSYLISGELVPILTNSPLKDFGQIYAVISNRKFLAPKVRAFLDFMVQESQQWESEF